MVQLEPRNSQPASGSAATERRMNTPPAPPDPDERITPVPRPPRPAPAEESEEEPAVKLVTVESFAEPTAAHMARNRLKSAGVRAYLSDEELVSTAWQLGNAVGGIKLQVREADVARAEKVLDKLRKQRSRRGKGKAEAPGDELASRALNAACLGIFFVPIVNHIWSSILLLSLRRRGLELTKQGRKQVREAWLLNAVFLVGGGLVLVLFCGGAFVSR